ncbi:hypothetical protein JX266_011015 [Neoarthrinium moseri]|nr:uncharacterized protein JN550_000437 [Neoarthrinium moseri]KAI1842839.1 hypothetical protein JX266_011015 [Neoarthrinium moseri]KAI1878255.1 hypothetical protein JN550_000437 [Neoarthrinium moseri]
MDSSTPMEVDAPKNKRCRSPDKGDAARKKPAVEQTVRTAPITLSTEMMLDKSADRPVTPSGGRPRSNAVWTPTNQLHASSPDCKVIMAGL